MNDDGSTMPIDAPKGAIGMGQEHKNIMTTMICVMIERLPLLM